MSEVSVTTDPPAWLADEPEIVAMLHAVVDRFDTQRGLDRTRDISVPATKLLRSLVTNDTRADDVWSLVGALADLGVLKIKRGTRNPYDSEWVNAKLAFPPSSESILRAWINRAPIARAIDEWREAVQLHAHAFGDAINVLNMRRVDIPGRTALEIVAALATAQNIVGPVTLRQLSAQMFWGDSKILDQRGDLIAALFPALQIRERPIVVCAYLPSEFSGVLFIENQDTYAAAIRSVHPCVRDLAFVYASGFRSSAARIRSRDGAVLHFSGPASAAITSDFERWWFGESANARPTWFWGDLDFAGMQIFKTLRARFEGTSTWRAGYDALLPLAGSSGSRIDRREQIDPLATGDAFADEVLLPTIRSHGFVDQESVTFL
jgi:hypothetical protein